MKKTLLCVLTVALCAAFPASALAAKRQGRGKKRPPAGTVLKRFDANNNGVIDEAEEPALQKAFKRGNPGVKALDKDKDGKLSSGEVFALQKGGKKKAKAK